MTPNRQQLEKAGFHALLAGIALWEILDAKTSFRKAVCAAWCAFHTALAIEDWRNTDG